MEIIILMLLSLWAIKHCLSINYSELQDEPYYFILETPDFTDTMKRGYGNGYVRVSERHPLYGKSNQGYTDDEGNWDYGDEEVDQIHAHGGITWCGPIRRPDEWVFGFDTSHLGDSKMNCTKEYVESECQKLLDQIKQIK